ncbi:MAG: shikimate kinase [Terriglobales bacterium]
MPLSSPLLLVGFMGSGKSTVGRRLAQRLGWHFVDLDERIETSAGAKISEIFEKRGEPAFRQVERQALEQALAEAASGRRTVLALGGGTYAQPANLEFIQQQGVVSAFLDVPVEELLTRCAQVVNRPLFRDAASFRALYDLRRPYYTQANVTVAGDGGVSPEEMVDRILNKLSATESHVLATEQMPRA